MLIRIILMIFSTILTISFAVFTMKGKRYESYLEALDDADYPLKDLYVAGFSLSNTKLFSLKGKTKDQLMSNATMLFGQHYAEFYANLIWAQALTFTHLFMCVTFWLAAMLEEASTGILVVGLGMSFFFGYYWIKKANDDIVKRQEECESELPEIVSSLALMINSGMTLVDAWNTVANSKGNTTVGKLMLDACTDIKNGTSAQEAIHRFGIVSNSNEIKKFTSSLAQGMQKGSEEIGQFLMTQAMEQWAFKKQRMIQMGEKAASAMLIPTTLIFVGVLVIIISTALGGSFF